MTTHFPTTVLTFLMLVVLHPASLGQERVVSLSVQPEIRSDRRVIVGGADAHQSQMLRPKGDLDHHRDLTKQISELFTRLEKTKSKRLLDDQNNLANLREWGAFAREFRSDLEALQQRVDKTDSLQLRVYLGAALGNLGSMFHDAAFHKENQYRQSKSAYAESLNELKGFIDKLESSSQRSADGRTTDEGAARARRIPADLNYSIVDSHVLPGIKRSLDVRLNRKVSEETLHVLALELKSQESRIYERTFIAYYLPDMKIGAGAWATTHFNPTLEVRILGLTLEQEEALEHESYNASREVIGSWIVDIPFAGSRITIFRQHGLILMETKYKDGSVGTAELVETSSSRGRRFDYKPDRGNGEYYLINTKGDLEEWDQDGPFLTAKRIR